MSKRFALAIAALCFVHVVYASDETNVGRYLTVTNKPTLAQTDLLSQIIQVRFSQNIQTIGDAMSYLLKFSGYNLIEDNKKSIQLKNTLSKPLPTVDRDFGPMSLKDALNTLIGPAFNLKQDILNRTIDFTLKPQFKKGEVVMNVYLEKFLNPKIFNFVVVPVSIIIFFAIVFMYAVIHEHHVNKNLLNQANAMEIQLTQLLSTNTSTDAFKTSLSHISDDLNSIKSEENLVAKTGDIEKVSTQINVIKQNIDELKKLVANNSNGKEFVDAKVLPFNIMSIDVISQQPFVSIEYDHHITPLGLGDAIAGWQITDADYATSQVEFKNTKNQYVKVNLQG